MTLRPDQRYQFRLRTATAANMHSANWGPWSQPTSPVQTEALTVSVGRALSLTQRLHSTLCNATLTPLLLCHSVRAYVLLLLQVAWPLPSPILPDIPLLGQVEKGHSSSNPAIAAISGAAAAAMAAEEGGGGGEGEEAAAVGATEEKECGEAAAAAEGGEAAAAVEGPAAAAAAAAEASLDAGDLLEVWSFLKSMDGLLRSPEDFDLRTLANALLEGSVSVEDEMEAAASFNSSHRLLRRLVTPMLNRSVPR